MFFFFFNDTATTEIYTLSLHDALPIYRCRAKSQSRSLYSTRARPRPSAVNRSEEHTSELQSHLNLVCRLLLEKKKNRQNEHQPTQEAQELQSYRENPVHLDIPSSEICF